MSEVEWRNTSAAQPEPFRTLLGAEECPHRLHPRPEDADLRLEELDLDVVVGLEPPPAEGDDGEEEVVQGAVLGVGWSL